MLQVFFFFTVLSKNNFNVIFSFGKLEAKYELYIKTNHSRCFPKECPWNPVAICTHINKVQSFKSDCFKLNGWVSAKQIDLFHSAWSIANYSFITMKGLHSINKIQTFKVT